MAKDHDLGSREINIRTDYTKLCEDNGWNVSDAEALKAWIKFLKGISSKLSEGEYDFRVECAKKEIRQGKGLADDADIPTPGPW
jgi:hypothetical protein